MWPRRRRGSALFDREPGLILTIDSNNRVGLTDEGMRQAMDWARRQGARPGDTVDFVVYVNDDAGSFEAGSRAVMTVMYQ